MNTCIIYLASPKEFLEPTQKGLSRLDCLKISLMSVRKHLPGLPIIIFHENYSNKEFQELCQITPDITFEQIDFSGGDEYFVYRKRSKNYMMMCRFFCGVVQSHQSLQKYDSYIRLDDDSFFLSNPDQNVLFKYDYSYRSVFTENYDQSSLFSFTKAFLEKKKLPIDLENLRQIGFLTGNSYNGLAPYNNFHFSKLSMWNNPLVKEYIDTIENQHGILKRMWLDANIHSMIVFMLAPVCGLSTECINTFGYRHNRHFSEIGTRNINYNGGSQFCPLASCYK